MQEKCCHCHRSKIRSAEEHKKLINRLNRIEGQIRGIKGMIENDAYCVDIMMQAQAASSALDAFNRKLLEEHIKPALPTILKTERNRPSTSLSIPFVGL